MRPVPDGRWRRGEDSDVCQTRRREIGEEGGKDNKDWSFAKKIAKKFTDEKRKTDKNFKLSKANSKQMLDEIKASPDYYYDFIEYKLHPDDNYSPGSKQWTKADTVSERERGCDYGGFEVIQDDLMNV